MDENNNPLNLEGKRCYRGGPGAGKTSRMLSHFLQAASHNIPALWILPTAGFAEHVKDLVLAGSRENLLVESTITTFDAWAKTTLEPDETVVGAADLIPLTGQVLERTRPEAFREVLDLPGFAKSLCAAVVELMNAGVNGQKLGALKNTNSRLSALAGVLDELKPTMDRLRLVLEGSLVFRLADRIRSGRIPMPALLLFDGFYDFTAGQRACFLALTEQVPAIRFTLPQLTARLDHSQEDPMPRIGDLLTSTGFVFSELKSDLPSLPPGLAALTDGLFAPEKKRSAPDGVKRLCADTIRQEIEIIANRIVRAKSEGEIKNWQDVGIICRSLRPYVPIIESIFARHQIPVSLHGGRSALDTAQGPVLFALLQEIGRPLPETHQEKAGALHRLARLSVSLCDSTTARKISFLLNFSKDADGRLCRRKTPPESLDRLPEETEDEKVREHLAFLQEIVLAREDPVCAASRFSQIVRQILTRYARMVFMASDRQIAPGEPASGVLRAFSAAADRLEQNEILFDLPNRPWAEHLDSFREQLRSQSLPRMTRLLDAVHVVDVFEARSWLWPVVYLIGLNNDEFPERFHENLFCRDAERDMLDEPLPTAKSIRQMENLLFGFAATRARRSLILVRHRFDDGGNEQAPSLFLDEVRSCYSQEPEEITAPLSLAVPAFPSREWTRKDQALPMVAFCLGRLEHFQEWESPENNAAKLLYLQRLSATRLPPDQAAWMRPIPSARLSDTLLPVVRRLAEPFSVSALQAFIECPFRYFAARLLKLNFRPSSPAIDPALLGSIAHETLRIFFSEMQTGRTAPELQELFHRVCAEQLRDVDETFDGTQELRRLENALILLTRMERESWLTALSAFPEKLEWSFGTQKSPLFLAHGDRSEPFTGRIDRIDRIDDALLVIDYKLSSGDIDAGDIKPMSQGLLPQLPIYCAAAGQLLDRPIAGMQIERIKHVDRSGLINAGALNENQTLALEETGGIRMDREEFEALIASALDHIFEFCQEIRKGSIAVAPRDKAATCRPDRCEFFDLCRVDL